MIGRVWSAGWSGAIAPDAWRAEVVLSRVRVIATVFGTATVLFNPNGVQGGLKVAALALLLSYGAAAAWLSALETAPARWGARRVMTATLVADGVLLVVLTAVLAGAPRERAWVIPVLLPIVGGLKLGPRGGAAGTALLFVAEAVGGVLRSQVFGLPVDVGTQISFAGIGVVGAILSGWVAMLAANERARAEAATQHLSALHEVILAGIGGGERTASARMVHAIGRGLDGVAIGLARVDEDGVLRSVVSDGLDIEDGEPIPLDPDGPAISILDGGPSVLLGEDATRRTTLRRDDARSAVVAPVRVHDGVAGVLVVVSSDRVLDSEDLSLVDRMADQMGLVLEAARAYDQEADLVERYRELDQMRAEFVSLTSHELRTPVTAIVGIAETLLHRDIAERERIQELAAAVVRQGRRLERLVDDLRTLTVMDQGGLRIVPTACAIADVVRIPAEASEADVVSVHGPEDLRLHADPDRVVQIVGNLLDNAAQHGDGQVRLRWWQDASTAYVEVTDDGPGVPPERRDRIFDRFETSANLLAHRRGTGLGLPLSRDLARAMDGELELVPTSTGATFRLSLPVAQGEGEARSDVEVDDVAGRATA